MSLSMVNGQESKNLLKGACESTKATPIQSYNERTRAVESDRVDLLQRLHVLADLIHRVGVVREWDLGRIPSQKKRERIAKSGRGRGEGHAEDLLASECPGY
jgi:hypothetical protein